MPLLLTLLGACAARVPLVVPPSPAVDLRSGSISVVAETRECRPIADRVARQLRDAGVDVSSLSPDRLTVQVCARSWHQARSGEILGRGQAIAMLESSRESGEHSAASLLAVSGREARDHSAPEGWVRLRRSLQDRLDEEVAQDLVEQVAPTPLAVRRRIYFNATAGSARAFHNLAVEAEQAGRLADALWWAERAHEARPSADRAGYMHELARRVSRTGPVL